MDDWFTPPLIEVREIAVHNAPSSITQTERETWTRRQCRPLLNAYVMVLHHGFREGALREFDARVQEVRARLASEIEQAERRAGG